MGYLLQGPLGRLRHEHMPSVSRHALGQRHCMRLVTSQQLKLLWRHCPDPLTPACASTCAESPGETDGASSSQHSGPPNTMVSQRAQQRAFRKRARALLASQARGQSVSTAAGRNGSGLNTSSSSFSGSGASSVGGVLVTTTEESSLVPTPSGRVGRGNTHHHRALVLDSGYRPINVVPWARAVMLDVNAKADVLDYYAKPACAYSGRGEHLLPAVVRVHTSVNLSELVTRVSCTRRNVMIRDKFMCQYCAARRDLTLDHVVPVSRGGKDTWTNLVTACGPCNQKKANQLLANLGWRLRNMPREPRPWEIGVVVGLSASDMEQPPAEWEPYIEQYRERQRRIRKELRAAGVESSDSDDHDDDEGGPWG